MKHARLTTLSVCLFALAVVSGCHGNRKIETGMPVIDRWISPGPSLQPLPMMQPGQLEYAVPPAATKPSHVPAPAAPSVLLRPAPGTKPVLPALPGTGDELHDTFFEDEAGYTPSPSY